MDVHPISTGRFRAGAVGLATAAALLLSGCFGDDETPEDPSESTQETASDPEEQNAPDPIINADDLPTVEDANLDRTNPSSVSYHWLRIARTIQPDLDVSGEAYDRVRSLSTPAFQRANSTRDTPAVSPWYLQGESLDDPVVSISANVTSMSPVDEFHEFDDERIREWTVVETAVTESGEALTSRSNRVVVTLVPDGDEWLVDDVAPAERSD